MALREIIARFGIRVDDQKLIKADKSVAGMIGRLGQLGSLLIGGVVARGLKNFVTDLVDAGDKIGKTATQLGLSSDALQEWSFAADLAGVDANAFSASLRLLQKNTFEAQRGSASFVEAFDKLGVSIEDSGGKLKTADVLMREVGLALNELESSTEKVALAQILMGRSGARLLPLFKDGAKGLEEMRKVFDDFGGGLGKDFIPIAEDAQDQFAILNLAVTSLKSRIGIALIPILSRAVAALSRFFAMLARVVKGTNFVKAALLLLGAVAAKMALKLILPFLPAIKTLALVFAKFLLVTLIVDDLITLFSGGKSVIGLFLDKLFGKGKSAEWVAQIKGDTKKVLSEFGIFWADMTKVAESKGTTPIGEAFTELWMQLVGGAFEFGFSIGQAIRKAAIDVGTTIAAIPGAIVEFASEMFASGATLAGSIVDGIVSGLKAGVQAVVNAASALVGGIPASIKKILQIGSPSRVAIKLGEQFSKGFSIGTATTFAAGSPGGAVAIPGGGGGGGPIRTGDIVVNFTGGAVSASAETKKEIRETIKVAVREERRATLAALEAAP